MIVTFLLRPVWWLLSLVINPFTIGFGIILFGLAYRALSRQKNFWADRGIAHKPYRFPFGNAGFEFLRMQWIDGVIEQHKKAKKNGGFLPMFDMFGPAVAVIDPDMLRAILVKDFETFPVRSRPQRRMAQGVFAKMMITLTGQDWKDVRSLATPAFSSGKIRLMAKPCAEQADRLAEQMYQEVQAAGGEIEMRKLFCRYAMDNIASIAFGQEADSIRHPDCEFARKAAGLSKRPSLPRMALYMFAQALPKSIKSRFNYMQLLVNKEASDYFEQIVKNAIRQYKENPDPTRNNFLQMMMDTRDENQNAKRQLTDEEIISQCVLFYIAGYDTVSNALTWTARCLGFNRDVQSKLQEEIDAYMKPGEENITWDMINEMRYLDNVFHEMLRLYPVGHHLRCSVKPYRLPGTDIELPANTMIYIPLYCIQRDPDIYPEPLKFDPDRFLPENKATRSPYTYLPFGHGPRNCIGMRFGMLQCKLALVGILRKYSFVTGPKSGDREPKLQNDPGMIKEKNGTWLKIEKRV